MSDQEEIEHNSQNAESQSPEVIQDIEDHEEVQEQQPNQQEIEGIFESIAQVPMELTDTAPEVIEETTSNPQEAIQENLPESQEVMEVDTPEPQEVIQSPSKPFEVAKDRTPDVQEEPVATTTAPNTTALQEKSESETQESIDISSIASFLDVDSQLVGSVNSVILQKLQARVTEFTDLKSEKLVLEVNLEQSTHLSNKRVELFKNQLSKVSKDAGELKEKNSSLESSKIELEKKLAQLETEYKTSSSASQLDQSRIDEILAEKRSTIELLEKKNREVDDYKNELNQLQESNSKLRKELIELETTNQTTSSNFTHTKFKLQSLETQIDLLTKNNDWLNKEIKTISTDFSEYRREKSTELSTLQSDYDNKVVEFNSLKARFDNLSSRFDEVSTNLDNALVQVKTLNDEKSLNQEEFFKEISLKDRLVNLLTKSNSDAKAKIEHLEEQLNSSKSDVANESGVLRTTLDKYKIKVEQSEAKIRQLEETIDDLTHTNNENVPSAPVLSPSAKATAAKYPGLSISQFYADFSLMKKQLTQERRAKERMQHQIDAFVNELEQKAPLINATKERVELLENELTDLSIILETTSKEKESLEKSYNNLNDKLKASTSQITTLNKQKVDLARQVQSLLVQVSIRGDSQGPLTPAEKEAFNRIAKGEKIVNESDTDKLISERLVVFQNIVDLQTKNEELLRITRDLGSKLEQEEQTSKSRLENLESSAVNEAKEAILTLQEEIKSVETKLNSVTRERDMFRSMLSNKSSSNILSGDFSDGHRDNEEITSLTKQNERLQTELESVQEHLKAVKVESETTINLLNKQINSLSNEKSQLAVNLAREKSSNTLADERYKSLQENIKFAKSENEELRKRSELLQENLAKQDLRTQHVAEELVQTRSLLESLRSESSNLKAEKQLWKSIEKRLTEENTSLIEEKAKLNALLVNLQTLERERESNATESQRRLIAQSESLEKELSSLRNKLSENSNELKEALTRKEADSHAYQERIDSLRNELGTAREELITRKATSEQLQAQIESLTSKVASAEARVKDFQNITDSGNSKSGLVNETLKLREQLEEARFNLEESEKNVAEFKSIASAAEEALKSMNESFDDYKSNTGSKISKLESDSKALNEEVSVLNDQITALNNELSEQKSNFVKEAEASKLEIETLRSQVGDSSQLQKDYDARVAVIESSYQQQVAIATEAQQNYDKELQKHAEVVKAVSSLREESNKLKETIQKLSSEAKQSKEELSKSQESWGTQRVALEEELRVAKNRVDDLTSQNHILYNQIESLSKRQPTAERTDTDGDEIIGDDSNDELRELISLLRREKDISDAQLEVSNRELKRVTQKLELVTSELDRSRLELTKLQTRDVDAERLSAEHEKLLQEINQLNLLRESNTTLRNELHSNIARIKELETKLSESSQKVEPLETEVVKLKAEISHKGQELKLVIEERDRWRQRSQDILNKYNRVDPEEHEKIKEEIKTLKTRNEELVESVKVEQAKFEDINGKYARVRSEAQEKIRRRGVENKALATQVDAKNKDIEELKKKISEFEEKLATKSSGENSNVSSAELENSKKEVESLRTQLNASKSELEKAKTFETKFNELSSLKATLEGKVKTLETEVETLKKEVEAKSSTSNNENLDAVNKLKQELETEKAALESSKEALKKEREEFETAKSNGNLSNDEISSKEAALKTQEEKLRAEFKVESAKAVEAAVEDIKRRIREPSQEKIRHIAEERVERFKKESAENLKALEKEINEKSEAEYKKKVEALEQEYKSKLAAAGTSDSSGDNSALKAQYEEQIATLKKESAELKKKSFDEGREATLKEVGMRTKLLQGKVEKLTKEKKELEEKLGGSKTQASSVPGKPNIPAVPGSQAQNRSNSKIPVNSGANQNQNKQQGKPHNKQRNFTQNQPKNQNSNSNEANSLKRPADQQQAGSKEKKSKSDA